MKKPICIQACMFYTVLHAHPLGIRSFELHQLLTPVTILYVTIKMVVNIIYSESFRAYVIGLF